MSINSKPGSIIASRSNKAIVSSTRQTFNSYQIKGYRNQLKGNLNACSDGEIVEVPRKTVTAALAMMDQLSSLLPKPKREDHLHPITGESLYFELNKFGPK